VEGEPGAGMTRAWLQPCASGDGRNPVQHQRMPCCFCPMCGPPVTAQTYTIKLPTSKAPLPPEVWFASAIFEELVYPYHKQDGGGDGGDGGGGGGGAAVAPELMAR